MKDAKGDETKYNVQLTVTEFIPEFDGTSYLQLPPMNNTAFNNVKLNIHFKPRPGDGLMVYSDKVNPSGHVAVFHAAGLQNGKFVYTYDVGNGIERLESPNDVYVNDWNSVEIKNDNDQASVQLNSGDVQANLHSVEPTPMPFDSTSLDVGGTGNRSEKYLTDFDTNYRGVVSSVVVHDEPLDLGSARRVGQVSHYHPCDGDPCENAGLCIPANVNRGFICQCESGFEGDNCERLAHNCGPEDCNGGLCREDPIEGTWACICPVGTKGLYCELIEDVPLETISFSSDDSFIALPTPTNLDDFSITLHVVPEGPIQNNTMLVYLAASYSPSEKGYLSVGIVDDKVVYAYSNAAGTSELLSPVPIAAGFETEIRLIRKEGRTELTVNGETVRAGKTSSFRPYTELYIGGLVPGIPKNNRVPMYTFRGCVIKLEVNGDPIDWTQTDTYSSGGVDQCILEAHPEDAAYIPAAEIIDTDELVTLSPTVSDEGILDVTEVAEPTEEVPLIVTEVTPEPTLAPFTDQATEDPNLLLPGTIDGSPIEETEPTEETVEDVIEEPPVEPVEEVEPTPEEVETIPDPTPETVDFEHPTEEPEAEYEEAAIEQSDDYVTRKAPEVEPEVVIYEAVKDPEPAEIINFTKPVLTTVVPVAESEGADKEASLERAYELPQEEEPQQLPPEEVPSNEVETTFETIMEESVQEAEPTEAVPEEVVESVEDAEPTPLDPSELWSTVLPTSAERYSTEELATEEPQYPEHIPVIHPHADVTPCPGGRCKWKDLCAGETCGLNGICRQYNETHFGCECKIYYDGPQCDIFKPIEHAAKFDGDAFIEISGEDFPHLSSEREETIEFSLKTKHMNGVILWQGQNPADSVIGEDYVSISVRDGFLVYAYELGGGAAELVSQLRIDDGLEHRIRATRRGRDGSLWIDNEQPVNASSSGILAMLNVDGNLFVGGLPETEFLTAGLHKHNFIGCISDVTLNGDRIDLMGAAIDGRNVRPCDEWVSTKRHIRRKIIRRSRWGKRGLFF